MTKDTWIHKNTFTYKKGVKLQYSSIKSNCLKYLGIQVTSYSIGNQYLPIIYVAYYILNTKGRSAEVCGATVPLISCATYV